MSIPIKRWRQTKKRMTILDYILSKLKKKPRIVILFLVCLHRFMGIDIPYIYGQLRSKHPEQYFMEGYMDCIMQKEGLSPDQKLRIHMYDILQKGNKNPRQINLVGSDFSLREESEIMKIIRKAGWTYRDIADLNSFEEYLSMGQGAINVCTYHLGQPGLHELSTRLGIPGLYMPMTYDFDKIDDQLMRLIDHMAASLPDHPDHPDQTGGLPDYPDTAARLSDYLDTASLREQCQKMLSGTADLLSGRPVALDASATPQVLGLARLLVTHGINVAWIYADAFLPEEEEDYHWLRENAPHIMVSSVMHHNMRVKDRSPDPRVVAVGQKAAYFHQTPHYVNMVEGGGLHGYDGILELLRRIQAAAVTEQEIESVIGRKGIGCSCLL